MKVILVMVALLLINVSSFGAKNLKPRMEIRCAITDGTTIDNCRLKSVMGSDDDPVFGARLNYLIPLSAGQLTALSAILSAGIAETKLKKNIQ